MESSAIRISNENKERLLKLRLKIAAALGRQISANKMIEILLTLGDNHIVEATEIAKRDTK